jgi:hypothetical protein
MPNSRHVPSREQRSTSKKNALCILQRFWDDNDVMIKVEISGAGKGLTLVHGVKLLRI